MASRFRCRLFATAAMSVVLTVSAKANDLTGQVVDAAGKPLRGVQVVVQDAVRGGSTDQAGHVLVPRLPPGNYRIVVSGFGLATQTISVLVPPNGQATFTAIMKPNTTLIRMAAAFHEPVPTHLAQKSEYLTGVNRTQPARRPNIVVILFDDLGYGDLSSYGNRLIRTPNIDALRERGVTLSQFYSGSPVCTPSRAALLTGRYPIRANAANHVFFPSGSPIETLRHAAGFANEITSDEILLPEVLRSVGYSTGAFGKWHLGDTPGHRPTDLGFDTYFGTFYSNDMTPLALYRGNAVDTPPNQVVQGTLSERFTDEAINFVQTNAKRPFFLYLPYTAPHQPHVPNPNHAGVSEGGTYGDVIEDLDRNVGRVMAALRTAGTLDNTLLIVTSDNGADFGGSAGDLRGRKGETFEGGMRVPAFVSWPGHIRPGSTCNEMAMNIDLLPTILATIGISPPPDRVLDGVDIMPMLTLGAPSPHDYLYYLTTWTGRFEAIRNRDFKFRDSSAIPDVNPFYPSPPIYQAISPPSLYDMNRDHEALNVAARHPAIAADLKHRLDQFQAAVAANPRGWR